MHRRALLAAPLLLAAPALAQSYPDRPVRLVIPYPAGGSLDVVGRAVGQRFQELTGQPLVLDNRGGASGTLAADYVAKSRPDGLTLVLASAGQLSIAAALQPGLPYDPRTDLVPVTWLVTSPFAMFASAQFGVTDLAGVLARGRAAPGTIPFGSPGNGSLGHLALEMFAQATGTRWLHLPYRGAALVMNDMAAGTVALTFTVPASALPMVQGGMLRPIAIAAPERSASMPDMPTFAELGLPQVDCPLWLGVMTPKGTPAPTVARLNSVLLETLRDPTVQAGLARSGATITGHGPAEFAALLEADYPRWGEVIRRGNITLN
jgi:tripartite-type tricarboxylate transporter receptor subunit TctC